VKLEELGGYFVAGGAGVPLVTPPGVLGAAVVRARHSAPVVRLWFTSASARRV